MPSRQQNGDWRTLTYSQVHNTVRCIGQALLDRKLSTENPIAILSENDIEHFLLMLAGQHVGIPTAHLSPVYSLISRDFSKLRHTVNLLTPGLVFVSDGILDAENAQGEMYGPDRLSAMLAADPDHSASQIADGILADVTKFQDGKDRFDDETIIVLKVR